MSIWSNMADGLGDWLGRKIAPYINDAMGIGYNVLGQYYGGNQRKQIKTKEGSFDDNVTVNFVGLAVDRSVSRLYRGGVGFVLPEGKTDQQEYIDAVWDLNKKEILLYQLGLHGAVYGTTYLKVHPEELIDPITGDVYPSLVPVDPEIIRIKTDPQDMGEVQAYIIHYKIGQTSYWEITIRKDLEYGFDNENNIEVRYINDNESTVEQQQKWKVEKWEQVGGGARQLIESIEWAYEFPPILHWKNLPSLKSCYGDSDIDDAINIQDKSNFAISNTGKIIRFHAHPQTIGTGFSVSGMEKLEGSPNSFHAIPNDAAKVYNLEMSSDLASSRAFNLDLRQAIFDVSREVDISSMADKLGALTNFGLQVLWSDAIDKNDTKRQLYGDALKELNRRILVLNNMTGEASEPGDVQWGNPLPVNIMEELTADQRALDMGVVDRETVAKRYQSRYGVDWETIKANLEKEAQEANAENDNIGANILRNFRNGKVNANNQRTNQPSASRAGQSGQRQPPTGN